MNMIEKFNEHKKAMNKRCEEAELVYHKVVDEATSDFVNSFRSLVEEASEEEFIKFVTESGDELEEFDKVAALAMRMECAERKKANEAEASGKIPDIKIAIISNN